MRARSAFNSWRCCISRWISTPPERFDNFERHIRNIPNVVECLIITGQAADFQLKILVRDMDDYQHLLLHVINRIEGVTGAHTSFVLRRVFEHRPVPTSYSLANEA